ncbi:MAG: T9SS type A sorting domain-containing protein [Bacteroidota bacterium]
MMRISILKNALRSLLLFATLAMSHFTMAQETLTIDIPVSLSGTAVTAPVNVFNFNDIRTMQFTLEWDANEMEFLSVSEMQLPGLSQSSFGYIHVNSGKLTYSWLDPLVGGVDMPNCNFLFKLNFHSINGNTSPITITSNPTPIEITNSNSTLVNLAQSNISCGNVQGNIFYDETENCNFDAGEMPHKNWKIQFTKGNNNYYVNSNALGDYRADLPPGSYDVSLVLPNEDLWTACTPPQTIQVDSATSDEIDFPVQSLLDCPLMSVDISAAFIRRCFPSTYHVLYCNQGTVTADDAYIEIELDPALIFVSSNLPVSSVNGNVYTFDLGDVTPGTCNTFWLEVEDDCNSVLGQTHCTTAHIFPDAPCTPPTLWDGSDLEITGICDGDSVRFEIINTGDDMADPVEFIIIEDDMVHLTSEPVQLLGQESIQVAVEANGSTWRVEIPETPDNPFGTFATDAVEGCGFNGSGSFSLGFVTQFPQDEQRLAIDVDCQENIGSYDPNDKTGYPKGFCQAHYISSDQEIEYRIRFQNTGTDTAFNITVTDTLSNFLSPASVRPGSSSHPYEFELLGSGMVKFTFPNIMLPDSNINEPASHGFIKFSVLPKENLQMGTIIENNADIFFDFNDPIRTNTYRHTIGNDFVEMQGQVGDLSVSGNVSTWWGTPLDSTEMIMSNLCPIYTDDDGNFLFADIDTADYTLGAFKRNDNPGNGLTVLDIVKLRNHILGIPGETLNGFQRIAGDVNGNMGAITTFDMVIIGKEIMGTNSDGVMPNWTFVTTDYNPDLSPLQASSIYQYEPLNMDLNAQNFWAIQPGNIIDESMVENSPINTEFYFEVASLNANILTVDVKARDFTKVDAFQFGLAFDPAVLQFFEAENAIIENVEFWTTSQEPGKIKFLATNNFELTAGENETLFRIRFNTLAPLGTSTMLELDESEIPLQVVVDTCKLAGPSVADSEITIQNPSSVVDFEKVELHAQVVPNPIKQGQAVQVGISSNRNRQVDLGLYELSGSLIEKTTIHCPEGQSYHALNAALAKGIYLLKVQSEDGAAHTGKVVVF